MPRVAALLALLVLSCVLLVHQCCSQVTFSRDWSAGKRSFLVPTDCTAHAHQSAALCQLLLNEMKQLTACQVRQLSHAARSGGGGVAGVSDERDAFHRVSQTAPAEEDK